MMLKFFFWGMVVLLCGSGIAYAGHYQYNTATRQVTGFTTKDTPPLSGHAYYEVREANRPSWPTPPDCTTGSAGWTVVNRHPNPTSIQLKSGLQFFRCQQVGSAEEVDAIVDRESKALCDSLPQPDPLLTQLLVDIDRLCVADSVDQDCIDARTAYTAIVTARARSSADDHADAKRVAEAIQTLHTEAATFKTQQGW